MARTNKAARPAIGVDLHTLEGLHQGSRTHCLELFSRVITRLPEMDFTFFLDTTQAAAEHVRTFTGVNARVVHMAHTSPIPRLAIHLPRLAAEHGIDLLHTQYICPLLLSARTAVTIHDVLFEEYPQYFETFLRLRSRLLFRVSALRSDLLFTVSEYSKGELATRYKIATNKITTLNNGVDYARFFPGSAGCEKVRALGLEPGEYMLSVGRLEPRKNYPGLLRAMAMLAPPRPKLLIIGQPDFGYEAIFSLFESLQLKDSVIFLQDVDDELLPALYRNARLFIYPTFAEGFGMPVIEAMASGLPVITSATTSLPEIAGDAALLIDPHSLEQIRDAILTLCKDDLLAGKLREAGLERARLFSWDKSADKLADSYRSYFK